MSDEISAKVVLLGETAVGKSCLITRFISDSFQENYVSTMAGTFFSKTIFYENQNKKIKYEIWDTAGQEKYRSLNKIFYQDAKVAILVIDITRKDTYQAIKDYWYRELKDNAPKNIIIAIAANKCDLYEYEEITKDELAHYSEEIGALYQQTSALNNTGINELFDNIGNKILSTDSNEVKAEDCNSNKKIRLESSLRDIELSKTSSFASGSNISVQKKKNCC